MADDAAGSPEHGGFLPPEPAGAEPDLGARPQPAPPTTSHGYAAPAGAAPTPQQQMGWGQPPPAPPPGYAPPPPPAHTGWQQPYQQQPYQHPPYQQQWGWQPLPQRYPDNGSAVAGFSLSLTAVGLLVFTIGLSSIVSIVCAGFGIFFSRRGKQKVDRGETPVNRGLAQAGFVIGIIAILLSVVAIVAWVALIATNGSFSDDFNNNNNGDGFESRARLAAVAVRVVATLVR